MIIKPLLQTTKKVSPLPECASDIDLANKFCLFFSDKITAIRDIFPAHTCVTPSVSSSAIYDDKFCSFVPATDHEIRKVINGSPTKSCELDPIPTKLLKDCADTILPISTRIINLSLSSGNVPPSFKTALVRPLLKKPSLDHNILKNYRPVSNLTFLSKVLERIVLARITPFLHYKIYT